jgi:hypothetical protein
VYLVLIEAAFRAAFDHTSSVNQAETITLASASAPHLATRMLLQITCPSCGRVGVTNALLPRVLKCHRCGHYTLILGGREVIRQANPSEPPIFALSHRPRDRRSHLLQPRDHRDIDGVGRGD